MEAKENYIDNTTGVQKVKTTKRDVKELKVVVRSSEGAHASRRKQPCTTASSQGTPRSEGVDWRLNKWSLGPTVPN